jgi:hypothetical protein
MEVCLVLALMIAAAQSPNLSGSWALDAPATSGQNFQLGAAAGTLTLEHKGEVVTGTWKGRMPEPWKLTGHVKDHTFELESETRGVPATVDGQQTTVPRHWVFRGSADGDKMTGSMQLAGGDGEPPSQPFSAVRKR